MTPEVAKTLPVYYIMAHSSYDYVFDENVTSLDTITLSQAGVSTFRTPEKCVLTSTTPVGALGLVFEDCSDEVDSNIVNMRGRGFSEWLFGARAVPAAVLKSEPRPRKFPCLEAFNLEGSTTINKSFQFFGDTLAGGGFGIVRLGPDESLGELVQEGLDRDKIYRSMKRTPHLRRIVKEAARVEKEISLQEIVSILGRGIYISCACSNVEVFVRREKSFDLVKLPFAAGRDLACQAYRSAYAEICEIVNRGNRHWESWLQKWPANDGSQAPAPLVDCTFRPATQGDFSPTSGQYSVLTRAAARGVKLSLRGFPSTE